MAGAKWEVSVSRNGPWFVKRSGAANRPFCSGRAVWPKAGKDSGFGIPSFSFFRRSFTSRWGKCGAPPPRFRQEEMGKSRSGLSQSSRRNGRSQRGRKPPRWNRFTFWRSPSSGNGLSIKAPGCTQRSFGCFASNRLGFRPTSRLTVAVGHGWICRRFQRESDLTRYSAIKNTETSFAAFMRAPLRKTGNASAPKARFRLAWGNAPGIWFPPMEPALKAQFVTSADRFDEIRRLDRCRVTIAVELHVAKPAIIDRLFQQLAVAPDILDDSLVHDHDLVRGQNR